MFLRLGTKPTDIENGVEYAATKLGVVLLVLGAMHFFNMYNFDRMRKKGRNTKLEGDATRADLMPMDSNQKLNHSGKIVIAGGTGLIGLHRASSAG